METLLLQDWLTIQNGTGTPTISQGAPGYLDVSEYQDLVFYLDAQQIANPTILEYQTAPSAEESAFLTMLSIQPANGVTSLHRADAILGSYAPVPPAKYARWVCFGTSYMCTFRIWVAGYRLP